MKYNRMKLIKTLITNGKRVLALGMLSILLMTSIPVSAEELVDGQSAVEEPVNQDEADTPSTPDDLTSTVIDADPSQSVSEDGEDIVTNSPSDEIEVISQDVVVEEITGTELDGLSDSDDLLSRYIEVEADLSSQSTATTSALRRAPRRNNLTGNDAIAYDAVKNSVAAVAGGTLSSSIFTVQFDTFSDGTNTYSPADLGLTNDDIISTDGKRSISDKVSNALQAKTVFELTKVNQSLLNDCPYDLYWYDKTVGANARTSYSIGVKPASDSGDYVITVSNIHSEIKYAVSSSYSATHTIGTYDVDTNTTSQAKKAVENAKSVVAQTSDLTTDYSKMDFFRTWICDAVSYNNEAVTTNPPYGDPWQLIYVFDNDASTNVVCEGYAKAFKFLCDLSTFSNEDVDVYTVTGTMSGGGHMWNIVHMNDDKNYMVDITNCDGNSYGNPDKLFMKKPAELITDGYKYSAGGLIVPYIYDDNTKATYSAEELTLATRDYDPDWNADLTEPKLMGNSIDLSTGIDVNFYIILPDIQIHAKDYVEFSVGGKKIEQKLSDAEAMLQDGEDISTAKNVTYRFTCPVSSKNMTDTITYMLYDRDGAVLLDGSKSTYSVQKYCAYILDHASETAYAAYVDVAKKLLVYGAEAQKYFNYNTSSLASNISQLTDADKKIVPLHADEMSSYGDIAVNSSSASDLLSYNGNSLILTDHMKSRVYLTAPKGSTDLVATGSGEPTDNKSVSTQLTRVQGNMYYVEMPFNFYEFNEPVKYRVWSESEGSGKYLEVETSPLRYCKQIVSNSSDEELKSLASSVFWLWRSAIAAANPEVYVTSYDAGEGYFGDDQDRHTTVVENNKNTILVPPAAYRRGYSISGWADVATPTIPFTIETEKVSRDLSLVAIWKENNYAITYDLAGGTASGSMPSSYKFSTGSVTIPAPTMADKVFGGWLISAGGKSVICPVINGIPTLNGSDLDIFDGLTDGASLTFTAQWTTPTLNTAHMYSTPGVSNWSDTYQNDNLGLEAIVSVPANTQLGSEVYLVATNQYYGNIEYSIKSWNASDLQAARNSDGTYSLLVTLSNNFASYYRQVQAKVVSGNRETGANAFLRLAMNQLAIATKDSNGTYHLVSNTRYVSNPEGIAYHNLYDEGNTVEGIQGGEHIVNAADYSAAKPIGVSHVYLNLYMSQVLAGGGYYEYNGKYYFFSSLGAEVATIRACNLNGISVTLQVMLDWNNCSSLINSSARVQGHQLYSWENRDQAGREAVEAAFSYIGEKFGGLNANATTLSESEDYPNTIALALNGIPTVSNFILGNEVNSCNVYQYPGSMSASEFFLSYAQTFRSFYNAIKSTNGAAHVYLCFDHCWNSADYGYSSKYALDTTASYLNSMDPSIDWDLAFHPYSVPLSEARFWNVSSSLANSSVSTPYITMANLNVLTNYLSSTYPLRDEYGNSKCQNRQVILSEIGYSNNDSQWYQAAALTYSYYLAQLNPMVKAFEIRSYQDDVNDGNLHLGLTSDGTNPKQAYYAYAYVDNPSQDAKNYMAGCAFYQYIGVTSWSQLGIDINDSRLYRH